MAGMSTPALAKLGHAVQRYRKAQGLSQEKLAERAGLHSTNIGGIERGLRNVSFLNLLKLAHALEVTLADLVQGIDASE
jgi:transcriptional regulator with XRE-family HTH domain